MASRRKPEVIQRIRPDVSSVSSVTRSKPSIAASSTTTRSNSIRQSTQGLPATPKSRNISSIESPTTKRATSFFSISGGGSGRSRPQVQAISGTTPRAKVSVGEAHPPSNSITNRRSGIESPEVQESIGSTRVFPPRRPIRFSDL